MLRQMEFPRMRLFLVLLISFANIIVGQPYIVSVQSSTGISYSAFSDTLFCGPKDDTFITVSLPFVMQLPAERTISEITIVDGIMLMDSMWRWHISPAGFFNAGMDVLYVDSASCLLTLQTADSLCFLWDKVSEYNPDSVAKWRLSFASCLYPDGSWTVSYDTIINIDSIPRDLHLLVGSGFFSQNYMVPLEGIYVSQDTSGLVASTVPVLFPSFPFYSTFRFVPSLTWTYVENISSLQKECIIIHNNSLLNKCKGDIMIYDTDARLYQVVKHAKEVILPAGIWIIRMPDAKVRKVIVYR